MNCLLDTCVLSEYVKKRPDQEVIGWLDEQDEQNLYISVITLGEIEKGIIKLRRNDPKRSQKLTVWLGKVEQRFATRTLPLDVAILRAWANLSGNAELGATRCQSVMDALLMATAQHHSLTIVTRNIRNFIPFPNHYNPWTA